MRPGPGTRLDPAGAFRNLSIDRHGRIPAYAQIKDAVRLACAFGDLGPGQTLPSIRALARHLRVGDGVVRRAYRELCEAGNLATERRKHVVVSPAVAAASDTSSLVQECDERSRLIMAWAWEKRASSVAFGRFLLARALAEEIRSPSYAFVDVNRSTADRCADRVARMWEIPVAGLSVSEFADFAMNSAHRLSAVLVNECLYEDVVELAGGTKRRILPVAIRVDRALWRRLRSIPAGSSLLCVFADQQFPRAKAALLRTFKPIFNRTWHCHSRTIGEIPDLATLIRTNRYRLILVGPLVWDKLPARVKRMPRIAQMAWEPDTHALEAVRATAGVLL